MTARKVLGYIRVSTQEQADSGYGLDVQRSAIRDYCKANGLRLVDVLSDEGQSGSNGLDARVGLAEALVRVESGEIAGLVVYRLDRLARDLLLQETLMARMHEAGGEVLSIAEPDVDSDDPTRILVRQVIGAISQYERAVIRGRMMAGKAAKVARGGYGGGRPGYGYRASNGELVEDETEQDVIARARLLSKQGRSLREIGAALTAGKIASRSGGRWHPQTVATLLRTPPH